MVMTKTSSFILMPDLLMMSLLLPKVRSLDDIVILIASDSAIMILIMDFQVIV